MTRTRKSYKVVSLGAVLFLLGIVIGREARDLGRPTTGGGEESETVLAGFQLPPFDRLARRVRADLDDGDYEFFPNRRSIWIVNRTNGRMANYHFHDDELGSVDRSRVSTIDLKTFPRKDTAIHLSDRNYNNILWVCNARTGDVQMWYLGRDGTLRAEPPITSSIDLMVKP